MTTEENYEKWIVCRNHLEYMLELMLERNMGKEYGVFHRELAILKKYYPTKHKMIEDLLIDILN